MLILSCWSPMYHTGSTTHLIILAYITALQYHLKTLVTHTGRLGESIESFFSISKQELGDNAIPFQDGGWDAVQRFYLSGKMSAIHLRNYTIPLLQNGIDLLTGTASPHHWSEVSKYETLSSILLAGSSYYDIMLLDLQHKDKDSVQFSFQQSHLIVVTLDQNMRALDHFFNHQIHFIPKEKRLVIVIGKYDQYSFYSLSNIKRKFCCKHELIGIPYDTKYLDASNRRRVSLFLKQHVYVIQKRADQFSNGIYHLAKVISKILGVSHKNAHLQRWNNA